MQKLWQCILSAPRGCCRREGALRPVPGSHWRAGRPAQQPVPELPEPGNRAQSRRKQRGGVRGDRGAAVSTTLPARGATVHLGSRLGSGSTHESRRNCLICKQQFIRVKGSASGHPSIQQTVNYRTKLGGEKYSPGGRIAFSLRVFPTPRFLKHGAQLRDNGARPERTCVWVLGRWPLGPLQLPSVRLRKGLWNPHYILTHTVHSTE